MRINLDKLVIRVAGSLLGMGWFALGVYALFGGDAGLDADTHERAIGFGVTFMIAGVCAVGVSWLVRDLSNIWCPPPRRARKRDA